MYASWGDCKWAIDTPQIGGYVLVDHVEAVAEWMIENGYDDAADKDALSAYNKAKEKVDG